MNIKQKVSNTILQAAKNKVGKSVIEPLNTMVDQNISDITTTIGSFIIRSIRGKFQRSITFTIGNFYADMWMEEALYGILYKYNDIKKSSRLELTNKTGFNDGSGMYYRLDDGSHNLKYRNYDILLVIQSANTISSSHRTNPTRSYTIITYNLSPEFVKDFERDMVAHRNSLLKIKSDSPTLNIFQDMHEGDGYTYWERVTSIPKRKIGTVYLPEEQKRIIVNTINSFFANKEYYRKHGVAHNLKILMYGPPGPQPVSIEIPTPDGNRRFGDIKPGDYVFGHNGQPTLVEEVYEYKDLDVYEVELLDGRKVLCSPEHKFPLFNHFDRYKFIEKSVYQMIEEGLKYPNSPIYKHHIPNNHMVVTKDRCTAIKNIRNLGYTEDMHCIHISDPSHIYLTTGFIPTCNSGKDTIAKMIASEWNRNLYYCNGGKNGIFIPNAITDNSNDINYPLFLISDIDKYPFLINEPDTKVEDDNSSREDRLKHKQTFGNMINALDGVLSGDGRIIIMTTNHIEKFSDTFLRPGRIDLKTEIGYVTSEVFRKYVHDFYNVDLPSDIKIKDNTTIASMQSDVVFMKMTLEEFLNKYLIK